MAAVSIQPSPSTPYVGNNQNEMEWSSDDYKGMNFSSDDCKEMRGSLLMGALADVTNEGPMASSGVFVHLTQSSSNNPKHQLDLLSEQVSILSQRILALPEIQAQSPETVRAKLGECVQSLRNLKAKITNLGETLVNNVHGLNELDSIATKADSLFPVCCKFLHQIQPYSSWQIVQFAAKLYDDQFLTVKKATEELAREFPA
jgi:hypothetical protein